MIVWLASYPQSENDFVRSLLSSYIFSEDGSYTVDHSSPVLLLKNGKYTDRITHHDNIEESLKIIKRIL